MGAQVEKQNLQHSIGFMRQRSKNAANVVLSRTFALVQQEVLAAWRGACQDARCEQKMLDMAGKSKEIAHSAAFALCASGAGPLKHASFVQWRDLCWKQTIKAAKDKV